MEYFGAVSGPNSNSSCSKSKHIRAAEFEALLKGINVNKHKNKDVAASDNTSKVNQVAIFRKLLTKGIY